VQIRADAVWVRSAYLSRGYGGGADGPFAMDADGFATVGDRGGLDQGLLTVTGRGAELVLIGGASVLVADVEQALRRATGSDVVIVGVPHPRLGQVVGAVVAEPAAAARIRAVARAELAPAQQPRLWFSVPSFPVTASGKVDRAALTAMAATGQLTTLTPMSRSGS
jgi:long-chain acyl-CoA synthetase